MKIQLVAFNDKSKWAKRLEMTTEIFNRSSADLILFSGNTLHNLNDLQLFENAITNKHTQAVVEVSNYHKDKSVKLKKALFYVHDGKLGNMFADQMFATANDIKNNSNLAQEFLSELQEKRRITIDGINFTILRCGEINIIACKQSEDNRPYFRFEDNRELSSTFNGILSKTDVFLNPVHTPMGNVKKLQQKKMFLSRSGRYCLSTNNFGPHDNNNGKTIMTSINSTNIHYAYHNGMEIHPIEEYCDKNDLYKISTYEISSLK